MKTAEDLEAAPISFKVSSTEWQGSCIRHLLQFYEVVLGTLTENPSTLSLNPSTIGKQYPTQRDT